MNLFEILKNWFRPDPKQKQQDVAGDTVIESSSETRQIYKPNFFIVGAAKSGTTSLWEYLRQHPDIFMPSDIGWKEPSYYCDTYGVKDYDFYLSLFNEARTQRRIGEASTAYLSSPESARRVYEACPEAKIIIMLRNPVDRAYSLYKWMRGHGYETLAPFEAALEAERTARDNSELFKRSNEQHFADYLYFQSGLYYEQVKRYFDLFPTTQIKVIILEEFAKNTLQMTQETFRFLNVDVDFIPEIKIHNESGPGYDELSKEVKDDLERKYSSDVADLSGLLERDLNTFWFGGRPYR